MAKRILLAVPAELYDHYLSAFTQKYPEEVSVIGNAEAFNVLMQMHDQERPYAIIVDAGLPGTPDPAKYAPKSMVEMIQHVRKARTRIVLMTNGITIRDTDRARLRMSKVEVVDGNPVDIRDIARALGLPVLRDFERPVLSTFSLKGGVGKSSVAANVAVRLAKGYVPPFDLYTGYLQRPSTGMKVLVWDLDFQSSDMRVIFDVPNDKNIYALFRDNQLSRLDLQIITKYIYSHPSGVDVFAAPPHNVRIKDLGDPEYASALIGMLLRALQQIYHVIIFDMPNEILTRPHVEAALRESNAIIHVVQPNKRSAKAAREGAYWLERLGKGREDIYGVMNRLYDRKLDLRTIEELMGDSFDAVIPEVKGFDQMQDAEEFPVEESKPYRDAIDTLIERAIPTFRRAEPPKEASSGPISGLLARRRAQNPVEGTASDA